MMGQFWLNSDEDRATIKKWEHKGLDGARSGVQFHTNK